LGAAGSRKLACIAHAVSRVLEGGLAGPAILKKGCVLKR
jgi:hypothetical protein